MPDTFNIESEITRRAERDKRRGGWEIHYEATHRMGIIISWPQAEGPSLRVMMASSCGEQGSLTLLRRLFRAFELALWKTPLALPPENCLPKWGEDGSFDGFM